MTNTTIDIIALVGFLGIVALIVLLSGLYFIVQLITKNRCDHEWECIMNSTITYEGDDRPSHIVKVYRCEKCGKKKRYKI